jgi:tetratricopeptide (TPR) repeat protein
MRFEPLELIKKRMKVAKEDSDAVYFSELLLYGEFITKLISIQLVSAILPDKERTRYKYEHTLVRGNAVGVFASTIDEIIINYRDKLIRDFMLNEMKDLTMKTKEGEWQYDAISLLNQLCSNLDIPLQQLPVKVSLNRWFTDFTVLRNKSKGHGALTPSVVARNVKLLEKSIAKIENNYFGINNRSWAYLYQNLSGKYKVSSLTTNSTPFEFLKTSDEFRNKYNNGCYCFIDNPVEVSLLISTPELEDFLMPNGNYRKSEYELLSYISGTSEKIKDDKFSLPVTELPKSHTEGIGTLDVQGESFGNLPPKPTIYINRESIEDEINSQLRNLYMSPIITLLGKGGIGKTTTALNCLHELSKEDHFQLVLWFSSRDIDLLLNGPKVVKAKVFSIQDIADEYCRLLEYNIKEKSKRLEEFQIALTKESSLGKTLFVFDNFETIDDPLEVYNWLYQYIRPPNKILITSRESRDFKGDYPIEIGRMNHIQCQSLIEVLSNEMNIQQYLSSDYIAKLINESSGHPYIIKILLGDVARSKEAKAIERIVADRDDILTALFRRTYSTLSRAATRVFLTLCSWRSTIPQIAVEAVLLRPGNDERIHVMDAIEELRKCSLIDVYKSVEDNSNFIGVPLAASIFGKDELNISPEKLAILEDRELLLQFGVTQENDVKNGLLPKIERKFKSISKEIDLINFGHQPNKKEIIEEKLNQSLPVLEYLCSKVPEGYKFLSNLYEELGDEGNVIKSVQRYIQSSPSDTERRDSWRKLVYIHRNNGDWLSESHSLSEICLIPGTQVNEISNISDRIIKRIMNHSETDMEHKELLFRKLSEVFEKRINESNSSTDYSRLAWLNIHIKEQEKALKFAKKGLEINPYCGYCSKIIQNLEG